MKKTALLLSLIASALFAKDYGFNDYLIDQNANFISLDENATVYSGYMPAGSKVFNYCAIQGGNIVRPIPTTLGTQVLKAFKEDELSKIIAMSKEDRITKYAKEKSLGIAYNKDFLATAMANRGTGERGLGGEYTCKAPNNKVLFTAMEVGGVQNLEIWIVNHAKEAVVDNVSFSVGLGHADSNMLGRTFYKGLSTDIIATLNKNYPTYSSYFDDWNNGFLKKRNKRKLGDNYSMSDSFSFSDKFWLTDSMPELTETQYFCEGKGGTFTKDGQPFREYLKYFFLHGAYPDEKSFVGNYACINTKEGFTLELDTYKHMEGLDIFKMDFARIKKGNDSNTAVNTNGAIGINPIQHNADHFAESILDTVMVKKAIRTQGPFSIQTGTNMMTAYYNGRDMQGCDLVSLEKSIVNVPNSTEIYSYKSCHNQLIPMGRVNTQGVPQDQELAPVINKVQEQCKTYGRATMDYQNTSVTCRALDTNNCNLEMNIFQNGKFVSKQVKNSCN